MKKTVLKRLRSPVVWAAVIAQCALILNLINPDLTENAKIITTAIVEILTLFGVLNNPSESDHF